MPAIVLDGKALSDSVLTGVARDASAFKERAGRAPKLAVVLVGDNPASAVYVASKAKTARRCGIDAADLKLPAQTSQGDLERQLAALGVARDVDGILLQLPLPSGLDELSALMKIPFEKDVDGLHPTNQGLLLRGSGSLRPCTPLGVMALIDQACNQLGQSRNIAGMHAVVVGRSILVGKPVAALLLERHCTVTMTHSRTRDLPEEIKRADIVVAALGKPQFIKGDWIKPGAIVIDVGINRMPDSKLAGDVEFETASRSAGAITPVPGGVGPMTIAMLLANTVRAAQLRMPTH